MAESSDSSFCASVCSSRSSSPCSSPVNLTVEVSLTSTESTGMRLTCSSATSRSSTGPLVQSNSYPSSPSMTSIAATPGSTGLLAASATASTSSAADVLNSCTPSRKRKRSINKWQKSKRKILRNTGKEYVTAAKKNVSCAQ